MQQPFCRAWASSKEDGVHIGPAPLSTLHAPVTSYCECAPGKIGMIFT